MIREHVPGFPADVRVVRSRWIPAIGGRLAGMRAPAAGVALGRTILVHPNVPLTDRLLRHELAHVRQWMRHGLRFPILYLWYHFKHGYRGNPFEIEARRAERSRVPGRFE
ncbi:MAG: hypothetical protein ACREL7_05585 [Longimicrobiales bacterium]